jgi:hypothetical protein
MKLLTSVLLLVYGCTLIVASTAHAQVTVMIDEVVFQSEAEEQFFRRLSEGEQVDSASAIWMPGADDPAAAMLSGNATLKEFVDGLRPKIARKKTLLEKTEVVELELKQRFLLKQVASATFGETMGSGSFSVFSATALYAMVFAQLDLPFEIRMEGEHAFIRVLTAPATILEVCPPKQGNLHPILIHERFAAHKMRSETLQKDKRLQRRLDSVPESRVSLGQLAGLQYIAYAQRAFAKDDWDAATSAFQKGFLLFPMELTAAAISACLLTSAAESDESDYENFGRFLRAYASVPFWAWDETMATACEKTSFDMAYANLDKVDWDQVEWKMFEARLPAYCTPSVRFGYIAAVADLATQKLQWRTAYTAGRELYQLARHREQVSKNLTVAFLQNIDEYIDFGVLADSIRAFKHAFPDVLSEEQEVGLWLIHYGAALSKAADNNDHLAMQEGYAQFIQFVNQLKPLPQHFYDPSCYTFERVFFYHFRKADYPQARAVLKQALDQFPDSDTLLEVKKNYGREVGLER